MGAVSVWTRYPAHMFQTQFSSIRERQRLFGGLCAPLSLYQRVFSVRFQGNLWGWNSSFKLDPDICFWGTAAFKMQTFTIVLEQSDVFLYVLCLEQAVSYSSLCALFS